jgi:hypothetical protein
MTVAFPEAAVIEGAFRLLIPSGDTVSSEAALIDVAWSTVAGRGTMGLCQPPIAAPEYNLCLVFLGRRKESEPVQLGTAYVLSDPARTRDCDRRIAASS